METETSQGRPKTLGALAGAITVVIWIVIAAVIVSVFLLLRGGSDDELETITLVPFQCTFTG